MTRLSLRVRVLILAATVLAFAALAVGYPYLSSSRAAAPRPAAGAPAPGATLLVLPISTLNPSTVRADDQGGVPRQLGSLKCARVYAAADTVACLTPRDAITSSNLLVLDRKLKQRQSIAIPGDPNRARVSASGRMVAWTTFTSSDSYNAATFATRTGILDTRTGESMPSLEQLAVQVDGKPYQSPDLNFWGVTFTADDNLFYATMSTKGHRYLIEGDFKAKTAHTVMDNVECPSLSPDGSRIAFKQAIDGNPAHGWRLSVLDLATMQVTHTAETASVDDQAAWLDNHTLAYARLAGDGFMGVWTVPADGSGTPRLIVPQAYSPAPLG